MTSRRRASSSPPGRESRRLGARPGVLSFLIGSYVLYAKSTSAAVLRILHGRAIPRPSCNRGSFTAAQSRNSPHLTPPTSTSTHLPSAQGAATRTMQDLTPGSLSLLEM
jgi:hypothetical protein